MDRFANRRRDMVEQQLCRRGISDPFILDAFRTVPRERFVDPELADRAYDDGPLLIAAGQTISQPFIVALMIQVAGMKPGDHVLEVGAGSGYAAAILGQIAAQVVAIERQPDLVVSARQHLDNLGCTNVDIVEGDGTLGWQDAAPYDAILAAASGSHVPRPLIEQLKPGGRIVMPIGGQGEGQQLIRVTMAGDGTIAQETLGGVRFVPLVGSEGWPP